MDGTEARKGRPVDTGLVRAQKLLEHSRWKKLLLICRQAGLDEPRIAHFWMTAACALDDAAEIAALIGMIGSLAPDHPLFRSPRLLIGLVGTLESTNHPAQAGQLLLLSPQRAAWSTNALKKAARITALVAAKHPRTSAGLLLLTVAQVGWQRATRSLAGKLAIRLARKDPAQSAALLTALQRNAGLTAEQRLLAQQVLGRLDGSGPMGAELQAALAAPGSDAKPAATPPARTASAFRFPAFAAEDRSFVAPDRFTFAIHRHSDGIAACAERFQEFQTRFLRTLPPSKPPTVHVVRDAYVNASGQIWTRGGAILATMGRKIAEPAPADPFTVDHATVVTARTKGIYHWLAEALPALSWIVQPGAEQIRIVTPPTLQGFKAATFRLTGIASARLVPMPGEVCFFRSLYYAGGSNSNLVFAQDFYTRFIARALAEATIAPAAKIYVSRRDSSRRVLTNEAEFEQELIARGFTVVLLSGMPLADQIALFARAETIVSPHGGGLTHLIFARPGTTVVEIVPATDHIADRSIHLRFNYARISMIKGLRYHLVLEECHPVLTTWKAGLKPILKLIDSLA